MTEDRRTVLLVFTGFMTWLSVAWILSGPGNPPDAWAVAAGAWVAGAVVGALSLLIEGRSGGPR